MLNFTVGPVQSAEDIRMIGFQQTPYFRTAEFSEIMLENEALMKEFSKASEKSKVVFITGSGTASMEASIINTLSANDKALIVNGGSFGQRFADICSIHGIPFTEIKLEAGCCLTKQMLDGFDGKGFTAFVVNLHETSTGVLYDLNLIRDFCKKNNLFLIVDAISSFLADEISMSEAGIDVLITGSQKALACPPGVSIIVLSEKALARVQTTDSKSMYLDLKSALSNAERGQTPFTPAVTTLLQIHKRLKDIQAAGGVDAERRKIQKLAEYFRSKIKDYPFEMFSQHMSNAATPLHPLNCSAYSIFSVLKDEYHIWVCPNGGALKDTVLRVGHIGALTTADYDELFAALDQMKIRNLL